MRSAAATTKRLRVGFGAAVRKLPKLSFGLLRTGILGRSGEDALRFIGQLDHSFDSFFSSLRNCLTLGVSPLSCQTSYLLAAPAPYGRAAVQRVVEKGC